jgi:dienelactone hydrolase
MVKPFGRLPCVTQPDGVRFCQGNGTTQRVPSWDGIPIDVDVTLPPAGTRAPYPTIVLLHGWGGTKYEIEGSNPQSQAYPDYNNFFFARHGYAVVNYSGRGEGSSCGGGGMPKSQQQTGPCARGFVRIADQRFDARDAQYLLGLLVDQGITDPKGIGVTGWSYGGGRSFELAYLRDRIRCAGAYDTFRGDPCRGRHDGALIPWRSPHGTPLRISAAWTRFGFSDIAYALNPNGRFLDYDPATDGMDGSRVSHSPVGVPVQSVDTFLYGYGEPNGYYERSPGPFPWDLTRQYNLIMHGSPAAIRPVMNEWRAYHSGFGIPGTPAPLLIEQGWADDLFPPEEGLRIYNDIRTHHPHGFVALELSDWGHARTSSKPALVHALDQRGLAFFNAMLRHVRHVGPRAGSVTAWTTTCPSFGPHAAPDGGPFEGPSWAALHPGVVVLRSHRSQTVAAGSGSQSISNVFEPISFYASWGTKSACTTVPAQVSPGTASYTLTSRGFTLLGLPTVVARVRIGPSSGDPGQFDARLWDVSGGRQMLVARTGYRLQGHGSEQIVFQLHGNGWHVAAGHTLKLELLGKDAPYYRASVGGPSVTIRSLTLVLPTLQRPNGHQIRSPASAPLPAPGESGLRTTQGLRVTRG